MHTVVLRGAALAASPAYAQLPDTRKIFYVHLLCQVDAFGCSRAEPSYLLRHVVIRTPAGPKGGGDRLGEKDVAAMLAALVAGGLVCTYEHDSRPYLWIPHYRQRLERTRLTCPIPPAQILERDPDALRKFQQVAHLHPRATVPAHEKQAELPMRALVPVPPIVRRVRELQAVAADKRAELPAPGSAERKKTPLPRSQWKAARKGISGTDQ